MRQRARLVWLLVLAACSGGSQGPARHTVTISGSGLGSGSVITADGVEPALACQIAAGSVTGGTCSAEYEAGASLSLTAVPLQGVRFARWTGAGSACGSGPVCALTVGTDLALTAEFGLSVAGGWNVTQSIEVGNGTCKATFSMQLIQTGVVFSGTHSAGLISCPGSGPSPFISGPILNGVVNGTGVVFDMDSEFIHHTGTLSGSAMSGPVTVIISSTEQLTGVWAATRTVAAAATWPSGPSGGATATFGEVLRGLGRR